MFTNVYKVDQIYLLTSMPKGIMYCKDVKQLLGSPVIVMLKITQFVYSKHF